MPVQLEEHKKTKSTPTAGPSADDRGPVVPHGGKPIEGRYGSHSFQDKDPRPRVMIFTTGDARVGMSGYIRDGVDGVLATFVIDEVKGTKAFAFVAVDVAKLLPNLPMIINAEPPKRVLPPSKPRVIGQSVAGNNVQITISHGTDRGVFPGTQGELVAPDGKRLSFKVVTADARKAIAYVDNTTVDVVNRHPVVELAPVPSAPVQRRANGAGAAVDVASTAQAGVAGASSPLPFLERIQRSFGKHDVSGVRAQIGGPAADASHALGARAYATGNTVAFASAPDLHTAAHEAAHTVQQARGAVGFQGLGAADDEHERHADAVADAVVAGRSAEALLDTADGGGPGGAIQRKPAGKFGQRPGVFEIGVDDLTKPRGGVDGDALRIVHIGAFPPTARGRTSTIKATIANETATHVDVRAQITNADREKSFEKLLAFRIVNVTPHNLEPYGLAEVSVAFTPRSVGAYAAVLELTTFLRGTLSLPLCGDGVETETERAQRVKEEAAERQDAFRRQVGPTTEVDVVSTEDLSKERDLSYEKMCERAVKLVGAGLRNIQLALSNFETVLRAPSASEAVAEGTAQIIFSEIIKHHRDHVAAYLLKALPFGSEIGEYFAVASWSEAVGKEKERSRQAGEDRQAMRFLVRTREWLGQVQANLDSNSTSLVARRSKTHATLDEANQALERNDIMIANQRYDRDLASGAGSVRGCFESIACEWTKHTKVPNSTRDAHMRIIFDGHWNLVSASLQAIRGERIADELTRDGREIDLQTLPMRRIVEWKPFLSRGSANVLPHQAAMFLSREIDDAGGLVETRFSEFAGHLKPEFEARVSNLTLPRVKSLKGTSAK